MQNVHALSLTAASDTPAEHRYTGLG
jgi:hypothetical protein